MCVNIERFLCVFHQLLFIHLLFSLLLAAAGIRTFLQLFVCVFVNIVVDASFSQKKNKITI